MPLTRRRRSHLSSVGVNHVEANGTACLCFAEDYSWFQGNINTDDESNYSLYGERVSEVSEKIEPNNNESDPNYYKVTLIDHFAGTTHTLPKIFANQFCKESESLLKCDDGQVSFNIDSIFKGQKADMIIQKHLGSSTLLGKKCVVYSGPISIVFNETIENGRSWCL